MELFKLNDDELCNLCLLQEKVTDSILPDILSMVKFNITANVDNAKADSHGNIKPEIIPQVELISYYINPIFEMEEEMKKRGLLKDFCIQTPFIDYEHRTMLIYDTYADRLSHLFKMYEAGFLTIANIDSVINELNSKWANNIVQSKPSLLN